MRTAVALCVAAGLLPFATGPRALAGKSYYVGGLLPGVANDGTWEWRPSGIQAAYDWIQANGAGDDWDIRVHADYEEHVGAGKIELGLGSVPVDRAQGGATWQTGATGPVNVQQDLTNKTRVTGSSDRVFFLHNLAGMPITLDGFTVEGSVRFNTNAPGSRVVHCHLSGSGSGTGLYVGDNCSGLYVMNTLIEGFATGLHYQDNSPGRLVRVVHSTLADNGVGATNLQAPWVGKLHFFNTIVASPTLPIDQTLNKRFYSHSDIYDGDGGFAFDGVNDVDLGGNLLTDPQLTGDYRPGSASPVLDAGEAVAGTLPGGDAFYYVDVDPSAGFQADADVVVAGTPPANAQYVLLVDFDGNPRSAAGGPDMGAREGPAGGVPVPEPGAAALLALGLAALPAGRRRRGR